MLAMPPIKNLFADAESPAAMAESFETFKSVMDNTTEKAAAGEWSIGDGGVGSGQLLMSRGERATRAGDPRAMIEQLMQNETVNKAVGADLMQQLASQLESAGDTINKEWTLTTPLTSGLVPFDLEAPAKLLAPRPTPWRNMFPRIKGSGTSHRYKTITGFSGSGTGGIGTINPGITESTTNAGPGGLAYLRGPYINYAATDTINAYVQSSLSDSVSWAAEYQGQGFQDVRSLSNTVLLYASMLAEERMLLYGRGTTGNGYVGALGTPGSVTLSAVAASVGPAGTVALTAGTYFVGVTADAGNLGANHEGPATTWSATTASVSVGSGQVIQVNIGTDVPGALGYNLYAASVGTGALTYQGRTGYNVGFIGGFNGSAFITNAGPQITSGAADSSALAVNYDGVLSNLGSLGGYVTRVNGKFSALTPGVEFQTAFGSLYDSVKGDPDAIWMNGFDRQQLSNTLQSSSSTTTSNFRVMLTRDDQTGALLGTMVSHIVNELTGKDVEISVHPWMPQGNATVQSYTIPFPDSNITNTVAVVTVQDYVAVQWPVTQFSYDASSFWISLVAHYAPAFSGLIQGIQKG